ncbi:12562_t:CDS:2, partial [Funneliformis mosseae]
DPIKSNEKNDHYDSFDSLYEIVTTEKFRPSLINVQNREERGSASMYINTKVRDVVECNYCGKLRCLFSDTKLTNEEITSYKIAIQT